jgi:carbonic anhydrase/acetyltransferase-like protein (isoleucine patch superfamily)
MIHVGKNTKSTIVSKGISAEKSQNVYRGLVKIMPSATGARNYSQCDSMLIGDQCSANTFPFIDVKNNTAIVEHEAQLGSHCHVAPGSVMAGRSEISDFCFLGAGAIIKNNTKVAANVCIGAGATVVGSIVNTGGIYIGTPAKKVAK